MGLDNPLHIAFLLIAPRLLLQRRAPAEMGRSLAEGLHSFRTCFKMRVRLGRLRVERSKDAGSEGLVVPSRGPRTQLRQAPSSASRRARILKQILRSAISDEHPPPAAIAPRERAPAAVQAPLTPEHERSAAAA